MSSFWLMTETNCIKGDYILQRQL